MHCHMAKFKIIIQKVQPLRVEIIHLSSNRKSLCNHKDDENHIYRKFYRML